MDLRPRAIKAGEWHKGRSLLFSDDDCIADPHWLKAGSLAFTPGVDAAWGKLVMPLREHPTDYELNAAQLSRAEFVTANCFCLKSVLEDIGGFDQRFEKAWREDSDLYFTLMEQGRGIMHVLQAVITHPLRPAPFGICLKQQANNLYEALLFKKHPSLYRRKISSKCMVYYYLAVAAFSLWVLSLAFKWPFLSMVSGLVWTSLFIIFLKRRLQNTSKHPVHMIEMAVTSLLIPPLSILWRLRGAIRYKIIFL